MNYTKFQLIFSSPAFSMFKRTSMWVQFDDSNTIYGNSKISHCIPYIDIRKNFLEATFTRIQIVHRTKGI